MFSDSADLLWFVLPSEATDLLSGTQKLPLREQYVFKPADFAPLSKGMVSLHNMLRTCTLQNENKHRIIFFIGI